MVYHHRHHPTTLLPGCCAGILQTLKRYGESGRFVEKKEGELLVLDDTTRRSTSHTQRRWTLSRTISNTHEIEGILVRGAPDFAHTEKNCAVSMVCPIVDEESSCSGEGITRTKEFIKYIPEK